jgi:malonyl-CoA O-methyltransferase
MAVGNDINLQRVRQAFDRAVDSYDAAAILQREVCARLLQRLDCVKLVPHWILDAGCGTGEAIRPLQSRYRGAQLVAFDISERMLQRAAQRASWWRPTHQVCGDLAALPFADNSFELLFSNLSLQWCNDPAAVFNGMLRVLKPGGLLMFTSFGPDTLKELRASWQQVDTAVHVNQFADMHDVGDALLQSGFADPVMEAEVIVMQYRQVDRLMQDLREIGANVPAAGRRTGLLTPHALSTLRAAYEDFRQQDQLPASYEIIYGHAWKPVAVTPRTAEPSMAVAFTRKHNL